MVFPVRLTLTAGIILMLVFGWFVYIELSGSKVHGDFGAEPEGFFSPHTASIDFCEPNYKYSSQIVELHNTWSSLVITGVAIYGFFHLRADRADWLVLCCLVFLGITGIGSAIFHATMTMEGQAIDELGMMAVILSMLAIQHRTTVRLEVFVVLFFVSAFIYSKTRSNPAPFQLMFIGCVVVLIARTLQRARYIPQDRHVALAHLWRGFIVFFASATLWLLEPALCRQLPDFLQLHAIWHMGTAVGGYNWLLFFHELRKPNSPLPFSL